MTDGRRRYIWQDQGWPALSYDLNLLAGPLADVARAQGLLYGRLSEAGDKSRDLANLTTLTEDVVRTSEIEGEMLNAQSVRSSIARRLGVDIGALVPSDRHIDGVVDMVLDATLDHDVAVTAERLFGWHAALFPTGYSGLGKVRVGAWRDDAAGPMEVVSGPFGRQRVHFEAPPAERLDVEMSTFLEWLNGDSGEPPLLKAGLVHLWFVTVHPFDDGNGRIARALGDLMLARADDSARRFYSVSAQIQRERADYYTILERSQKGSLDVTGWLEWFLGTVGRAVAAAEATVDAILVTTRFWRQWSHVPLNARQIAMVNRMLDGFTGKLTSGKWAKISKCSQDTALRDINELIELGVLRKSSAGGRNTSYELVG